MSSRYSGYWLISVLLLSVMLFGVAYFNGTEGHREKKLQKASYSIQERYQQKQQVLEGLMQEILKESEAKR